MSLVLDTSVALAWIYPEETTSSAREVLTLVTQQGAWVPSLWPLEIANVLQMGIRKGRHDPSFRDSTLLDLALLPISIDAETNQHAWHATVRLAERHRLTLYDAAYLELAIRRTLPLGTLDRELRRAATLEGVELLGL